MNKFFIMSALAAAALLPFAAQAQDSKAAPQGLTRAEVLAELQRARASGEYDRIHAETPNALMDYYARPGRTDEAQTAQRIEKDKEKKRP